jgi:hypothetical protein
VAECGARGGQVGWEFGLVSLGFGWCDVFFWNQIVDRLLLHWFVPINIIFYKS